MASSTLSRPWALALFFSLVSLPVAAADLNLITADPVLLPAATCLAAPTETLIRDRHYQVRPHSHWDFVSRLAMDEMRKRDDNDTETDTDTDAATTTDVSASSTVTITAPARTTVTKTLSASTTSTTSSATTSTTSALPSPFDSGLSSVLASASENCSTFVNDFLADDTFQECYPLSMLLQGSSSFFEAEKSLASITRVLDTACSADVTSCAAYLSDVRTNLISTAYCAAEYASGNSLVVQANLGLLAYETLYAATCLQDPDSDVYCFGSAVTNETTTANAYLYYLPLNISLPSSSEPTCNWCLQQTMAVYHDASANRTLPIARTYESAADRIDTVCGSDFVNTTLPAATTSAGSHAAALQSQSWLAPLLSLAMTLYVFL